MPELPLLQSELARVTEWIRISDQKSAFLSVYYTAAAGFVVSQRDTLTSRMCNAQGLVYFMLVVLALCALALFVIGAYFLLSSVFPRLKNQLTDRSLFYFGSVARRKYVDYLVEMEALTEEESKKQMIEQIFTNSTIADTKMKCVQRSTICLCGLLLALFLLWI